MRPGGILMHAPEARARAPPRALDPSASADDRRLPTNGRRSAAEPSGARACPKDAGRLGSETIPGHYGTVPYQSRRTTMSDHDETPAAGEVLSEQQRIEQLERAGKLNRLLIYGLAGALLLNLLAWILVAALSGPDRAGEDQGAASMASVEALHKELGALQLQIAPLQQQIKDQQKLILLQAQQQMGLPTPKEAPAAAEPREQDRENVRMLARTLIGQE